VVDWSARSRPALGRDSVWIGRGVLSSRGLRVHRPCNPPTREQATGLVRSLLQAGVRAGRQVLVGFDFPLGYPQGFGSLVAGPAMAGSSSPRTLAWGRAQVPASATSSPWGSVWDWLCSAIVDEADNTNNRFEVASDINRRTGRCLFWGRPAPNDHWRWLPATSLPAPEIGPNPLGRWRLCEQGTGRGIKTVWQLFGGVTVGSQALLGIPRVDELRHDAVLSPVTALWPFETGLRPPAERWRVVLAEVWPSAFYLDQSAHPVRDAAQVLSSVRALAAADRSGLLPGWFCPPRALREEAVVREEGWMLGLA
jgi:precorrin-8X/cobalt-precorrin-8 methylmutase